MLIIVPIYDRVITKRKNIPSIIYWAVGCYFLFFIIRGTSYLLFNDILVRIAYPFMVIGVLLFVFYFEMIIFTQPRWLLVFLFSFFCAVPITLAWFPNTVQVIYLSSNFAFFMTGRAFG